MRKKILVTAMLCMAAATCVMWGRNDRIITIKAAEVQSNAASQYEQLDMPVIAFNTTDGADVTSDEDYAEASIDVVNGDGEYELDDMAVSVRLRGNTSLNADKKSYKLKFDKKQNLLSVGDGKGKTWGLIANYFDQSQLRNWTAYSLANKMTKMPYSVNSRSVEVYVNGEYEGVYLLCELANVNKNRVDIAEEPDEVENNGYLVEMSRYTEADSFDVDTESYKIKSDLSEDNTIKTKQTAYISDYLEKCITALKQNNQEDASKYIDIDSLVDMYIGNEIVKNIDTGWDSFYMYKDAAGKLTFGPMWDFDLALGNADSVKGLDSWKGFNPFDVQNNNANSNPWFCYALNCQWFRQLVQDRWKEVQSDLDSVSGSILIEAQANYDSYMRNYERWDVLGKRVYTEPANIMEMKTFEEHYTYLSDWVKNRVAWLTNQITSDNFIDGIFLDQNEEAFSDDSNLLAVSSLLAYGIPPADLTYEMTDDIGMTLHIKKAGSFDWAIQALAGGFMLEKDADYELSFDYSCSKDASLSFALQANHDSYEGYFRDSVKMTSGLQHYNTTFTAGKSDTNCTFAANLGNSKYEGCDVTIRNMCLVKKTKSPEITPSPEPSVTPSQKPSNSGIDAKMDMTSDWGTGAVANITITNNSGEDITDGWTLDFDLNREITNLWNATLVNNKDGHYTVKSPDWMQTLKAGESYTIGFQMGAGESCEMSNVVVK